jgi:hypothetical protein
VVKLNTILPDLANIGELRRIRAEIMGDCKPASTLVVGLAAAAAIAAAAAAPATRALVAAAALISPAIRASCLLSFSQSRGHRAETAMSS